MDLINRQISQNSALIKLCSLVLIVIGHFFDEFPWIFSWIAIFNFSFLSGYFTYLKYSGNFNFKIFWKRKIKRLGFDLFVINTFLLALFTYQGKSGILTWQTLLGISGLNGFINWFYLQNPSPFRVEIWFLTLLLLFYLVFPIFRLLYRNKFIAMLISIIVLIAAGYLNSKIKYNFALWFAICGFLISCAVARLDLTINLKHSMITLTIFLIITLLLNLIQIKAFNFYLIFICSLFLLLSLIYFSWPKFVIQATKKLVACPLEIYLIHRYLFFYFTGYSYLDFGISLTLIFVVAIILKKFASLLVLVIYRTSESSVITCACDKS